MGEQDLSRAGEGLTRRDMLKRGVFASGALLWARPVVESFGVSQVLAAEPSPGACVGYCIKWEVRGNGGSWEPLSGRSGRPGRDPDFRPPGHCIICPEDSLEELPPNIDEFQVDGDPEIALTICLPEGCRLVDPPDPSGDDFEGAANVWVKCARECDPRLVTPDGDGCFTVEACGKHAISHVEMIVCC